MAAKRGLREIKTATKFKTRELHCEEMLTADHKVNLANQMTLGKNSSVFTIEWKMTDPRFLLLNARERDIAMQTDH